MIHSVKVDIACTIEHQSAAALMQDSSSHTCFLVDELTLSVTVIYTFGLPKKEWVGSDAYGFGANSQTSTKHVSRKCITKVQSESPLIFLIVYFLLRKLVSSD